MDFPSDIDHLRCVSLKKAACTLDMSTDTIERMLRAGEMRGAKIRGEIRVYVSSIDEYLKNHEITPRPEQKKPGELKRRIMNNHHDAAVRQLRSFGILKDDRPLR